MKRELEQPRGIAFFKDQLEKFKKAAEERGWTLSFYIRQALDEYIQKHPEEFK